jgi:hypothetical protein
MAKAYGLNGGVRLTARAIGDTVRGVRRQSGKIDRGTRIVEFVAGVVYSVQFGD